MQHVRVPPTRDRESSRKKQVRLRTCCMSGPSGGVQAIVRQPPPARRPTSLWLGQDRLDGERRPSKRSARNRISPIQPLSIQSADCTRADLLAGTSGAGRSEPKAPSELGPQPRRDRTKRFRTFCFLRVLMGAPKAANSEIASAQWWDSQARPTLHPARGALNNAALRTCALPSPILSDNLLVHCLLKHRLSAP